ncbi:MAG: acyl carrier protein [Chloroflexi bacterium]|jgi:acyl carrier protein|nr:MAG: acyl carrier protein [Chloroflexota bacterium]|tara:strand:+ start:4385 stop:4648 length:264 start_codon:yes stop_codon:yes gene_type:complete
MSTVFERVQELIVEQLGVDKSSVVMEASFIDDLNADSLDLVELIMSLEEEFSPENGDQIEISDDDAEKIRSVKNAVDYLVNAGIKDE